jgi:hypothetical protein
VTVAGKVTVLNVPEMGPLTKTLPAPHRTVAEHVPPPNNVTPPVRVLPPVIVGDAVVGGVAASVPGNDKVTLPAVADGAIVPKRISAGWDSVIGGKIVALTGMLLVSPNARPGAIANVKPSTRACDRVIEHARFAFVFAAEFPIPVSQSVHAGRWVRERNEIKVKLTSNINHNYPMAWFGERISDCPRAGFSLSRQAHPPNTKKRHRFG